MRTLIVSLRAGPPKKQDQPHEYTLYYHIRIDQGAYGVDS